MSDSVDEILKLNGKLNSKLNYYLNEMTYGIKQMFNYGDSLRIIIGLLEAFKYTDTKHKETENKINVLETELSETKKQLSEVETMVLYLSKKIENLEKSKSVSSENMPNFIEL
jgi:hypothetical protein